MTATGSHYHERLAGMMDLTGRTALVTGAAGHIGLAVAETLAELGGRITLLDVDGEALRQGAEALSRVRKDGAITARCDLRDEGEARGAVRAAIASLGGLDILVHCAAYVGTSEVPGWSVPFERQSVEAWDTALRVNLTAAFVLVQEAREALSRSGHGSVVFVGSTYGLVAPDFRLYEGTAMANPAGYGASKGGLLQLMRYLATLLAPRVRVNAISPGGVWRNQPAAFHDRYVSRTPLGRMATEDDFRGAVAYLATDLSAYVTGHNLVVDGGWTIW